MKKADLTKQIAKESNLSQAAAADQLDRLVHEILQRVRKGQPASLPGLGTFGPGLEVESGFEASKRNPRRKSKKETQ